MVTAYNSSRRRLFVLGYNSTLTHSDTAAAQKAIRRTRDHFRAVPRMSPGALTAANAWATLTYSKTM